MPGERCRGHRSAQPSHAPTFSEWQPRASCVMRWRRISGSFEAMSERKSLGGFFRVPASRIKFVNRSVANMVLHWQQKDATPSA